MRFALSRPRALCLPKVKLPLGEATLQAALFDPMIECVSSGPKTAAEMAKAAGKTMQDGLFMVCTLFGLGYIYPMLASEPNGKPALQFNQAMIKRAAKGRELQALASARLGSACGVGVVDQLFLLALSVKAPDAAVFVQEHLLHIGRRLSDAENKPVQDDARHLALLREAESRFRNETLPLCRSVGLVQ
jgi:hypothetical protein